MVLRHGSFLTRDPGLEFIDPTLQHAEHFYDRIWEILVVEVHGFYATAFTNYDATRDTDYRAVGRDIGDDNGATSDLRPATDDYITQNR